MRALVEVQIEKAYERASGKQPPGDWACVGCGTPLDGFTNTDAAPDRRPPGPGSLSVCAYCAVLQRVNAAGVGFEPVSTRELNALPKSVRMELLRVRSAIEKRIAHDKRRS